MQEPEAAFALSPDTLRRYNSGNVSRTLKWLLRYPSLMRRLAEFAEQNELRRKGGEAGGRQGEFSGK